MSIKSRLELLKKIEKSAQITEQTQMKDTKNEEAAWDLFDQLFQQVLLEEVSKVE